MPSLRREGTALFYEDAKGREPPILLVHGWGCDHTYLGPQFEHFGSRGHRVVAVDLHGHAQSDKPHQRYTMQVFADDLCVDVRPAQPGQAGGGGAQHGRDRRLRSRRALPRVALRPCGAGRGRGAAVHRPRRHLWPS
jgi:hypothetical protein